MPAAGKKKGSLEVSTTILHTAKLLFAEHGVESVSMHQVAKAANIGQGTLYRRYANKSDLCMDLMKDNFSTFAASIDKLLHDKKDSSVQERFNLTVHHLIRYLDEQFDWISVIHIPRHCEPDQATFFNSPPYQFLYRTYESLLLEAHEKQELIELDIEFTTHMLITSFPPESFMYMKKVKGYSTDKIAASFCQISIDPLFLSK
ncbi:TetR/AcrR family transcriptional regulator [Paenibacillus gorillae]|uniref:TetR/AcrR family transcriptional regulator n=1 Tax=Paenibacillus gorillae TaxID=1243662 RepID=UPI0004B40CCD|nr:TetR/AcrR family transcriptional regulator [Paenibacillus gorillae]